MSAVERWTFTMVDLAGFTALTETHGDDRAADVAVAFAEGVGELLPASQRLVKSLGDAVLLAAPEPAEALASVSRILERCYEADDLPVLRVGMHHGPAVARGADFFGAAVNLAARVTAQAAGGQVLGTAAVAAAAAAAGTDTVDLGPVKLKNVAEPVRLWEIRLRDRPAEGAVDPVCRMHVLRSRAAGVLRFRDREHLFCSLTCAARFAAEPDRFG